MKVAHIFIVLFISSNSHQEDVQEKPCHLRSTHNGFVCVCNEEYCDYMDEIEYLPTENGQFSLISSSSKGLRFFKSKRYFNDSQNYIIEDFQESSIDPLVTLHLRGQKSFLPLIGTKYYYKTSKIFIDRRRKYQIIEGFGGAFTGSVGHILDQLSENFQNHIYKSYYSTSGIGYNIMRLTIGGCDFDLEPWAYNEKPQNEIRLTNFTKLDRRDKKKVEKIKKLMKISKKENIKFKAAAWSPPKWMKTNNEWTGLSFLKKEYYQTWADYHLRFLELMAAENISIWAISTGNEPLNGIIGWYFVRFMSLGWTPGNQGMWVEQNLGPTIKNSPFKNVKILSNDDQRYTFPQWFKSMEKSAPKSLSYIDGFAVHWYWDSFFSPTLLDETLELYGKGKILITTESCVGDKPYEVHGPELGSWKRAEKYVRFYIENLQHGSNGWIDWNLILDEKGGPNYVNNRVDAPIIVKTTGRVKEIYKQPIFYAIGHFSKFITEGSVRISSERWNINIDTVAFLRPDGYIVCVIYNFDENSVSIKIIDSETGSLLIKIPGRSVHTLIYR